VRIRRQHEACRFYYSPKKREVTQPMQVSRSRSELVRFHNGGSKPSRSASSGSLTERSFRRTHFDEVPTTRPTRDVREACHFHLAAKTRRASPQPKGSIPIKCEREACRFHIEPFSPGRSSPLRRPEHTLPQAKGERMDAVCMENAGCNSAHAHDDHVVIDLAKGLQHSQPRIHRQQSLGAVNCRYKERSSSPHHRWHVVAAAPSEQQMQRAHSWAPERCRHVDSADGPTTVLTDPVPAAPSRCLASNTCETTRVPHAQPVGGNAPCKPQDSSATSQAESLKDLAHSSNSQQLLPQTFQKILHYVERVPLLGRSPSVTASAAPAPPRSYTQRRAAQKNQRRLSLPVTCNDSDVGCPSDLQALRQRRAPKWRNQPRLQP